MDEQLTTPMSLALPPPLLLGLPLLWVIRILLWSLPALFAIVRSVLAQSWFPPIWLLLFLLLLLPALSLLLPLQPLPDAHTFRQPLPFPLPFHEMYAPMVRHWFFLPKPTLLSLPTRFLTSIGKPLVPSPLLRGLRIPRVGLPTVLSSLESLGLRVST